MRSALLFSALFLSVICSAAAQPGWFQLRSEGDPILFSVDMLDADNITAVGSDGLILQSSDGGSNWLSIPSAATDNLRRIRWYSPSLGVILGNDGVILKSTNAGGSWTQLSSGTSEALFDIHFVDENNWLVVGQAALVMTTTNGGAAWEDGGSGLNNYNEITFHGDLGIVVGNKGTVRVTEDGGGKWKDRSGATANELTSVSIGDDSTAIAVGANGTILRTEDKGRTWTEIAASIPLSTYRLSGVRHLSRERVVIAGYGGLILWSTDTGLSWYPQESNTSINLEALAFLNNKIGVAAGWNGTVMRTNTAGSLGVTKLGAERPSGIRVQDAWPNPVRRGGNAKVRIEIPGNGTVNLRVYDLLGRECRGILNEPLEAGSYSITWDATLPKGVYLYRLEQNGSSQVRKFTILD